MEQRKVEVAIIGAGTAGMVAYQRARKHTDSVLLLEGGQYGTTCARVGCMPSKLLIAAANAAHDARNAALFGVASGPVEIDGIAVMDRVRSERDRFVASVVDSVESYPEHHRMRGQVRFAAPHRLIVADHTEVTAERIVIATGSRPKIPGFLKEAGDRLIVNDDVFDWHDLPQSVAVFGPGVIGLELGQALARLGVRIRMFGVGGNLGSLQDPDLRSYAHAAFNREFPLDADANVTAVERTETGVRISFDGTDKQTVSEEFDYLLAATGRQSNIDSLDIQNADLQLDDNGMPLFDSYTMRCGDSHIFIAGDTNNDAPLLHEAADEGRIAGNNAGRYPDIRAGLRKVPLAVVFTEPQIASVGLTLQQVDERCRGLYAIGEVSFENQGRSRVIGKNCGLLRVYGEHGSGLFMGAEMFGPAAEHIAHLLAWSAQRRMTVSEMLDMPFYHPVIEEGLRTALQDLSRKLSMGPAADKNCMDCGPGV